MLDFDWFFYIAKVHLNFSKQEFYESCPKELIALWEAHCKFNKWTIENNTETENNTEGMKYKRVNIDDISFL